MKRRSWLGVASRDNRIEMLHRRSAGVESRLDDLLVKGREYRKGINFFEISWFLENLHEHVGALFDTTGRVHVFCLFIVTGDIHEIVVGEQHKMPINYNSV